MNMRSDHLFELHGLAVKDAGRYPRRRFLHRQVAASQGRHFIGIVGPRGVGKSVLLRQLASERDDSLYVSLDGTGWWSSLAARIFDVRAKQFAHGPDVVSDAHGHEGRCRLSVLLA